MQILIPTITAFLIGVIIVLIDTESENKESNIEDTLPGVNCGACGYGTCSEMAKKINEDFDNYKKCRLLRGDKLEKFLEKNKHLK